MINKTILLGRLGTDPVLKYTASGQPVANFTLATSEKWSDKTGKKQEKTEWHRIVIWGKLAEVCSQYLKKGRLVYLEGKIQSRSWQDKSGQTKSTTEILVNTVDFVGTGPKDTQESPQEEKNPPPEQPFSDGGFDADVSF